METTGRKVSPDTWISWNQARWLVATRQYSVVIIPLLRYLLLYMPPTPPDPIPRPGDDERLQLPQTANSTTGLDGQPLRYAKLMKGNGD